MSSLKSHFGRPLGCFTDLFPGTPAEKAAAIAEAGFDCVQLWPVTPTLEMNAQKMKEETKPFADAGLRIVAIAGYQNIISPDPKTKAEVFARLEKLFELAAQCGAVGVACETGTKCLESPWEFSPENLNDAVWDEMMEAVVMLSNQAVKLGSRFLVEGYVNNVVRTADDVARLKEAIPGVGFVMDPFNVILEERLPAQAEEIALMFDAVGDRATVAHAKDLLYTDGKVSTPRAGTGVFDYPTYFRLLDERMPGMPLILEHLQATELSDSLDYLKRRYAEIK